LIFKVFLYLTIILTASASALAQSDDSTRALIHIGDVVDVDVVGDLAFDWRGPVSPEGFIDPTHGVGEPIFVLCRRESEVAAEITKIIGNVLREPKINVRIIDRSGRPEARLIGSVRTPTRFRILRDVRLSELIVAAGGFIDTMGGTIHLTRAARLGCSDGRSRGTSGGVATTIKVTDLVAGKDDADPLISSGDLIDVVTAKPVYVIGQVRNPRPVPIRSVLTLAGAIAGAGGLAHDAGNRAFIYRRRDGILSVIEVDISAASKNALDVQLSPFDILEVGTKRSERRSQVPEAPLSAERPSSGELPLRIIE
jgi:protein involved in polysaccharide export with SLBB domain